MPQICSFFGIDIWMYWERNSRHKKAHFHAIYNEFDCTFSLPELTILEGQLPSRQMRLVKRWANEHLTELIEDWTLAINNQVLKKILPLD